jgi:Fe2+ transport system protein B
MDPITLFAMANAAVSAVKKGCQLYKDIKGAAGDVKGVLKDLDDQFHNLHKDKPPTVAQKNAYIEEKNRVIELNKQQGETAGIYQELANYLGDFFDNMNKCMAVIEEEERKAREEIYEGDASLGRRALQLVIMKKQLEQMKVELREMMVYQAPPELGALWTDVSEMMNTMGKQQKVLIAREMQKQAAQEARRAARMRQLTQDAWIGVIILFAVFVVAGMFMYVAWDRQRKYPQYGNEIFPKTERQRKEEAEPQVYIGR